MVLTMRIVNTKESSMTTKVWTKKITQKVIKDLRKGGYKVRKEDMGYYIVDDDTNKVWKYEGRDLFRALDIGNGYLINFHPSLWQGEF